MNSLDTIMNYPSYLIAWCVFGFFINSAYLVKLFVGDYRKMTYFDLLFIIIISLIGCAVWPVGLLFWIIIFVEDLDKQIFKD
jgi:hypothetical protein